MGSKRSLTSLIGIHNRPLENDCYDDFVKWCRLEHELPLLYTHWRDDVLTGDDGTRTVCFMQDPVGKGKARRIPKDALNHPDTVNRAVRDIAYPIWRNAGLFCPGDAVPFDYGTALESLPCLLKDTGKQMGRVYFVDSEERLDWVWLEASRFNEDKFRIIPFVDTKYEDGFYRMHRYLVAGDKAIPCALSKTKSWLSKASRMSAAKKWSDEEWESFLDEWEVFWNLETVHPDIVTAVTSLDVDFALVDATHIEGEDQPIIWEINPYVNLRPSEVAGKRERTWPFMANYFFGTDIPLQNVSRDEVKKVFMGFKGFGTYWRDEK